MNVEAPVVVVGFSLNGLGVVRSLAPLGVRCFILYNDRDDPCLATRYGVKIRVPGISAADVLSALRRIKAETGRKAVLFLTNDVSVASISRNREAFRELVELPLPDHDVVDALLQKDRCRALYEEAGIDQPETVCLTRGGADDGLDRLRYPCILKASEKPDGYSERFRKAYIVESAHEARAVFSTMEGFVDRAVIQEWIEGQEADIYFGLSVMGRDGRPAAAFCGRKINSWPPRMGNTARCVPAPELQGPVLETTTRFFERVGLVGFGALEFKRDARDGRLCVIEPTVFRPDYQAEIATLNGINLPEAYYCLATGQSFSATNSTNACGWSDPVFMGYLGRASRQQDGLVTVAMKDAYWRPNDPMPWLRLRRRQVRGLLHRALKKLGPAGARRRLFLPATFMARPVAPLKSRRRRRPRLGSGA